MNNIGKIGENKAAAYLSTKGYKILDRNFRIRGGEIDIVAIEKNTLVFVEVKTRSSHKFGLPEEAITSFKINFIKKAAQFYRLEKENKIKLPQLERIDVVSVDFTFEKEKILLIPNITG